VGEGFTESVAVGDADGDPHSKRSGARTGRIGVAEGETHMIKRSGNNMTSPSSR
jgi:hypothetical protein